MVNKSLKVDIRTHSELFFIKTSTSFRFFTFSFITGTL